MIVIEKKGPWKDLLGFFDDSEEKLNDIMREVERDCAKGFRDNVKKRISGRGEYRDYGESLKLKSLYGKVQYPLIVAVPKSKRVEKLDPKNHVLAFKRIRGRVLTDFSEFLVKNSPFPLGYLKNVPREIDVIYKKVSESEVEKTREIKSSIFPKVQEFLKDTDPKDLKPVEVIKEDLEFFGLRLEKGMKGYPRKPHWLPTAVSFDPEKNLRGETVEYFSELKKIRKRPPLRKVKKGELSSRLIERIYGERFDTEEV